LFCPVLVYVSVPIPVSVPVSLPVSVSVKPSITVSSFAPFSRVSEGSSLQLDVFDCVNNLAHPFIQISWRDLRLVLPTLGLNSTPKNFSLASQLRREIGLLPC